MRRTITCFPFVLIIICLFSTLVNAWLPFTAHTWVFLLLGCIISIFAVPAYYRSGAFFCVVAYLFILLINFVAGDKYFNTLPSVLTEVASMIFPVSLFIYAVSTRNRHAYSVFVGVFIVILLVAAVGTFLADHLHPQAVRLAAIEISSGEGQSAETAGFYRMGMTNYSLPHALPVLIPAVMMGLRNKDLKRWSRTLCIILLIAILSLIWFSAATTPLLFAVIILILSSFTPMGTVKENANKLLGVLFIGGLILVFHRYIGDFFIYISNSLSGEGVSSLFRDRLAEVGYYLQTGQSEGDLEARSDRYSTSLQALYLNVLWGTNDSIGHHSALIDRFASLGIIGALPWILTLFLTIKITVKHLPSDTALFYLEGIGIGIAMLLTKNMANMEMWFCMFFILPIMLILFRNSSVHTHY